MKKGQKTKKYSPEFKIGVILDMRSHRLGYRETVRKYWRTIARSKEDKYKKTPKRWKHIYWKKEPKDL